MGTGWRRAFCTTIHRDQDSVIADKQQTSPSSSPSPRSCTRLGFFSGGSNPTTPRFHSQPVSPSLRCKTTAESLSTTNESPRLQCKTTPKVTGNLSSNPNSPRPPLKLSLFKNSFKFRSSCGICLNSVKTGQGTAIYTAECAHAFHFPCIAEYVRKHGKLVCPVCNATWNDVPLLSIHKNLHTESQQQEQNDTVDSIPASPNVNAVNIQPQIEEKRVTESSSPRAVKTPKYESRQLSPKLYDLRSYDDDEPLLSPTAGGIFNPIPEADENAEDDQSDDVEEFQGFFVSTNPIPNPNPPESLQKYELPNSGRDSRNVRVRLLPESAVLSACRGYETYAVALRVKAPRAQTLTHSSNTAPLLDPSLRAPIDLVTVLDASDSMAGPKLQMLKRAMRLLVASLGSTDRLSIVAFSASPKRLLPLRRMRAPGRRAALRIIDRLVCAEGTSLRDALKKANKVLEDRRERNPVASVMLFSDGQDKRVQTNASHQRKINRHVSSTRFAHIEIPVLESGFGRSGSIYGRETVEGTLAKCIGGLLNVVVQDLRIQLNFASGSAPAEISAVYSLNGRPTVLSSGSVRLGDLYVDEDRELLVEMRVPCSAVGAHHVMSVRCLYKDAATQEVVYGRDQALLVPRPHAVRSSSPKIERLRNLFISTRAIAESRRLIEQGDLTSAYHLLASSRALLLQSSSIPVEEYVMSLESELAELNWHRQQQIEQQQQQMMQRRRVMDKDMTVVMDENGEPLTPGSAWRAAERLAKVAMMKKSLSKVGDLHGFENARF